MRISFHDTLVYIANEDGQELQLKLDTVLFTDQSESEEEDELKQPILSHKGPKKTKKQAR